MKVPASTLAHMLKKDKEDAVRKISIIACCDKNVECEKRVKLIKTIILPDIFGLSAKP